MEEFDEENVITNYLLGGLSEEDRAWVEDLYLSDDDFFEKVRIVEAELVDRYVKEQLPKDERKQFEENYLKSAVGRDEVEFARSVLKVISDPQRPYASLVNRKPPDSERKSWLGFLRGPNRVTSWSFATAVLLMAIATAWLVTESWQLRFKARQLEEERAEVSRQEGQGASQQSDDADRLKAELELERQHSQKLEQELEKLRGGQQATNTRPASLVVTKTLLPLVRQSSGSQALEIPREAKLLRLQISPGVAGFTSYRIVLTGDGDVISTQNNLKPVRARAGSIIVITVPVEALNKTNYQLTLSGIDEKGEAKEIRIYPFTVVKK